MEYVIKFDKTKNNSDNKIDVIRITYFNDSTRVSTLSPTDVYNQYSAYGYVEVPEGVTKVSVTWWTNTSDNVLYIFR